MGYRAPSAESVYRYALRLDITKRYLTDRFNLSIVLVNDTSLLCREFLETYCIDLCFRTADRVRFIFFSELPEQEFPSNAQRMPYGIARSGLLQWVLDSIRRWGRREPNFDRELEPWRRIRPEGLQPLSKLDDIQRQLSWECNDNTAMPGAGMAMQFAQRLGIGRYVPCVVVFTDIGQLRVDVMPVSDMLPHEIYAHVRWWVDSFYEVNREKIERWSQIEREIEELCSKTSKSLWEIRNFREKTQETWENLVTVSELIRVIETGNGPSEVLSRRISRLPEIAEIYKEFLTVVQQLENRDRSAQTLRKEQEWLCGLQGGAEIFQALRPLGETVPQSLGIEVPRSVRTALSQIWEGLQLAREPMDELEVWWNRASKATLSQKRFVNFRRNWAYLIWPNVRTTVEAEFALVANTLRTLPLSVQKDDGASTVLEALAAHYDVDHTLDEWHRSTAGYRAYLVRYLSVVCDTVPAWLLAQLPDFKVQDVHSLASQQLSSFERFLDAKPEIVRALNEAELLRRPEILEIRLRNDQLAAQHQAIVCRDLEDLVTAMAVSVSDWVPAKEMALLQLGQWRTKLEGDIKHSLALAKRKDPVKDSLDVPIWNQLMGALDDYDRVVESIEYPHLRDPLIRGVPLNTPVTEALGLNWSEVSTSATQRLRKRLHEAVKSEPRSAHLWNELRSEVAGLSSVGQLTKALGMSLTEERYREVIGGYEGRTLEERVEQALDNHRGTSVLERLDDSELERILNVLSAGEEVQVEAICISKQQKIGWILSKLGLYDGRDLFLNQDTEKGILVAQTLQAKMDMGEYDVFLAHNAKDKPIVLQIGGSLMRRGVYPWIDIQQVPPGRWFQDVTQAVVTKVKSAAIFLGPHGIGRWQAVEIRAFISQCLERGIPVIPVLLPGVKEIPQDMGFLRELTWVQFHDDGVEEEALDRLIWGITGKRQFPISDAI